ncbi:MAG: YgjV family protein [Clostridia bacterium]|nr:YgjV family protein [Clostridia bacterium]
MPNETVALGISFLAMALIVASYFFEKKVYFLLFQALGTVFLVLSYLFSGEYFAMIGLSIGLCRTLTYFFFERRNKTAPIYCVVLFCALTLAAYFTVNLGILKTAKPIDIFYVASLILYAIVFRIKDVELMRYLVLLPTALAVLYNVLCAAPVFTTVSYAFEVAAGVCAVIKFNILGQKEKRTK